LYVSIFVLVLSHIWLTDRRPSF